MINIRQKLFSNRFFSTRAISTRTCSSVTVLSATTVLLAVPAASFAMPSVTGNTLTWPDDGWYQVQRADTFETVCEGSVSATSSNSGGPCTIDAASHIVINHSTGERFENIRAESGPVSSPFAPVSAVTVNGSTISWPDDGWYQVQNIDTFESVCEGGTSCDVAAGNYVVINHSTGERFEGLSVSNALNVGSTPSTGTPATGSGAPAVTGITVNGQLLSWPDDGWYQVQQADNYATVCEGGSGCEVSPGDYVVINHSSGVRTSVSVTGSATGSAANPATNPPAGGSTAVAAVSTRVDFDITVPVYVSDSLQVLISFGDLALSAAWVVDETWVTSGDFPADTADNLVVTFVDRNGEIVLGTYETSYRTGTSGSETIQVSADQFETVRWDDDSDGVSNLAELLTGSDPLVAGTAGQSTTRVNFGINVPAYMSNELQLQLVWGDRVINASWAGDEFWTAFDDLPSDVEQPLSVNFFDRNGAIELGSYETTLRTESNDSQYVQFETRQISTNRFDRDLDGRSNYYELLNGTDPLVSDSTVPPTFTSVQNSLRVNCGSCHSIYRGGVSYDFLVGLETSRGPYVVPFDPEASRLVQRTESGFHGGQNNRSLLPQLLRAWMETGALDN